MSNKLLICLISIFLLSSQSNAGQLSTSVSTGYEKISSPLVRIDVDQPLILVEGRNKLHGHFYQINMSGLKDWDLGNENSLNLSANAIVKQSPSAQDLNMSIVSADATWRKKMDDVSLGLGASVQKNWIANASFRDSVSIQSDLVYANDEGNFTDVYMGVSKNYFVEEFSFFNSQSTTLSLTQHFKDVALGFSALDLQFSASREKNTQNSDDLSNHSYYARASLDRKILGFIWSVGLSITKSHFDEPFFDGFAKRHDKYISYEFGVEREFSDNLSISIDLTNAKNNSNLALFESDYKAASLSLRYNF